MRANLQLFLKIDEEENEIKPLENLRLFSSSSGTTISSSTSIDQTYIDSNHGPYTVEGGTADNIVTISIISDLTITSSDTYFIINSDYIIINSDIEKDFIILINDVLLYGGLVLNSNSSNVLINGITIKGSNSTLNPGAGWIAGASFGIDCINILIENCSNYLPIAFNSGGIVGRDSKVFTSLCNNYGELLVNPLLSSDGFNFSSRSGGIYGRDCEGNCDNCTNYGILNGRICGGIIGRTNKNFNITECLNCGNINNDASAGIIASLLQNSTLDNILTISNCSNEGIINGIYSAGIIFSIDNVFTLIQNCKNYGTIISNVFGAGIVGQIVNFGNTPTNYTNIKSCKNYGKLNSYGGGGIARYVDHLVNIEECNNYGNIEGNSLCGGIVYLSPNTTTNVLNCNNEGNISGHKSGGIFGDECQGTATNCTNNGEVSAQNSGGIVGPNSLVNVINCTNSGNITGEGAGGIYGAGCGQSVIVDNSINNGEVSGNNAGGIFGAWCPGTAKNCTNAGSITGVSAGGIYGEFSTGSAVNCINNGNLYGVNTRSI